MNRFDISLLGVRLIARGNLGIVGALAAIAMFVGLTLFTVLVGEVSP